METKPRQKRKENGHLDFNISQLLSGEIRTTEVRCVSGPYFNGLFGLYLSLLRRSKKISTVKSASVEKEGNSQEPIYIGFVYPGWLISSQSHRYMFRWLNFQNESYGCWIPWWLTRSYIWHWRLTSINKLHSRPLASFFVLRRGISDSASQKHQIHQIPWIRTLGIPQCSSDFGRIPILQL